MVRPKDLSSATLILASTLFITPADAQPIGNLITLFPFQRAEFTQQIDNLLASKGLRGSFQRDNCQETETASGTVYSCDYSFYNMRYRLWQKPGSERVALITARPPYATRYNLGETASLGLSLVIAAIEGTDDDAKILAITDRLRTAGRSMSGSSTVETNSNRYELNVGRSGYTFWAASRSDGTPATPGSP